MKEDLHTDVPPEPAAVRAQRAVRKVSKIRESLTTEELCGVLKEIGLEKCVPIVKNEEIDGQELLNYRRKEFTDLLIGNGFSAPKARTTWDKLQSHLEPAAGHVGKHHVVRALVVGMDKYSGGLRPLKNGVKDAYAMAEKLESAGVIVTVVTNATIDVLEAKTKEYISTLEEGDVGLLFYAGHGTMFKNTQRLIAIPKGEKVDYDKETLKVEVLVHQMSAQKTKANIVFLDCCRDFKYEAKRNDSRGGKAMASGQGNVISYACSPNHKAYDGADVGHGLYTACLLRHILTPNIDVIEMLKRVNQDLIAMSQELDREQIPYINSSLNIMLHLFCA